MTTVAEQNLENARILFISHCTDCKKCHGFDHSAKSMSNLCWMGSKLFQSLLEAENHYIVSQKIPLQPATSCRKRALERILGQNGR